jgi:hypothetical protein
MLWIPHCLDSRLTDGGKVVSLTNPPHFTPQKYYFSFFVMDVTIPLYSSVLNKCTSVKIELGIARFLEFLEVSCF